MDSDPARIRAIEARTAGSALPGGQGGALAASRARPLPLGIDDIDAQLGGGIAAGSLHEISGPADDGAAPGFATALLAGFARRGPVVWIAARRGALYAPGLAALGLPPARLLVIEARTRPQRLWAFEEALRTGGAAAVLAELDAVDFNATRRLQLAAAARLVPGLILDQGDERAQPSAARTRWRIATAPSLPVPAGIPAAEAAALREESALGLGPGAPRWHVGLRRARPAGAGAWLLELGADGLRLAMAEATPHARASSRPPAAGHGPSHHADGTSLPGALAAAAGLRPVRAR
jgi:protein ImuA